MRGLKGRKAKGKRALRRLMTVTIRQADLTDPGDAERVIRLTDAYAQDPMGGGKALPTEVKERLIPAMIQHGNVDAYLALHDDDAIGLATTIAKFSTFAAAPTLNVHDIYVHPDHRGQGTGRTLLAHIEERAREQGYARLNLEVLTRNPARRLYERAGYQPQSEYWVKPLDDEGLGYATPPP